MVSVARATRFTVAAGLSCLLPIAMSCQPTWVGPARIDTWNGVQTAYVCLNLPPGVLDEASEAVRKWDRSLRQWRRFIPVQSDGSILSEFENGCSYLVSETNLPNPGDPLAVAWASRIGGKYVYLRKGYYENDVEVIVMHELGHSLGAQHVAGTLMNPTYQQINEKCPDVYTVSQVAAYNGLDMSTLSWCASI